MTNELERRGLSRKTCMVYITGEVVQPNCSTRTGPTEVNSFAELDQIPELVKRYETREGYCSHVTIKVVK